MPTGVADRGVTGRRRLGKPWQSNAPLIQKTVVLRDSQETVELMGLELTRRATDWRPYKKRSEQPSAEMDQARLDTAWI